MKSTFPQFLLPSNPALGTLWEDYAQPKIVFRSMAKAISQI